MVVVHKVLRTVLWQKDLQKMKSCLHVSYQTRYLACYETLCLYEKGIFRKLMNYFVTNALSEKIANRKIADMNDVVHQTFS